MKREIKFRAWCVEHHKMWKIENVFNICNGTHVFQLNPHLEENNYRKSIFEFIIMQYTGLKDKNGKEIYEGDIVTCEITEREQYQDYYEGVPIKVEYNEECAGFYPFIKASQWRSDVGNVEIIGNIYENPKLLQ